MGRKWGEEKKRQRQSVLSEAGPATEFAGPRAKWKCMKNVKRVSAVTLRERAHRRHGALFAQVTHPWSQPG